MDLEQVTQEDWWAITSIHEAAHAVVALAVTKQKIVLTLNRHARRGNTNAGTCLARFEQSVYGQLAHVFVKNAPFVAHQYECLPCGNKGDLHERTEAYAEFCKMIGAKDQELFRKHVDAPLLLFFGSSDVQAAVLFLANRLYDKGSVTINRTAHWQKTLDIPDKVYKMLVEYVRALAEAME